MKNTFVEEPLTKREQARLREELLAYTEAKKLIGELAVKTGHRKRAVTALYNRTGGNKWLSPGEVAAIVEETKL